jgi:DNA adenine methylase
MSGRLVALRGQEPSRASLRPPLKWAGGKRWQVAYVRSLWEPHRDRRYVEAFCGGLAMGLAIDRQLAKSSPLAISDSTNSARPPPKTMPLI